MWLKPFLFILNCCMVPRPSRNKGDYPNLIEKLETETSVIRILKRIQKLTALTNSLQKFMGDDRVGKLAD